MWSRKECNVRHPRAPLARRHSVALQRAWLCGLLIVAAPAVPLPATPSQQQKAIVIDDFESGTLASWKVERSGSGGWFVYTNGKTPPNPPESYSNIPFAVRTRLKASLPQ